MAVCLERVARHPVASGTVKRQVRFGERPYGVGGAGTTSDDWVVSYDKSYRRPEVGSSLWVLNDYALKVHRFGLD